MENNEGNGADSAPKVNHTHLKLDPRRDGEPEKLEGLALYKEVSRLAARYVISVGSYRNAAMDELGKGLLGISANPALKTKEELLKEAEERLEELRAIVFENYLPLKGD